MYFDLIGPWTRPERMQPYRTTTGEWAGIAVAIAVALSVLVIGVMLARRNLRLSRGDRRGANRLAVLVFAAWGAAVFLGAHHVPDLAEVWRFVLFLSFGLTFSSFFWVLYIAMEPYVRRSAVAVTGCAHDHR